MSNCMNHLCHNIKHLRTVYGETQLELSLAIGLDSPNTISNYEKGKRCPEPEIRKKIAAHFRITEDELVNSDFSYLKIPTTFVNDKKSMVDLTLLILPIIRTEESMKDTDFQKAYEAHMRAVETMKAGKSFSDTDYEICFDCYQNSYDKNGTTESVANILWWLLMIEFGLKNQWMIEGAKALAEKNINGNQFIKNYYLKDMSETFSDTNEQPISMGEMSDFEGIIVETLRELKSDSVYSELADYYIALRYSFGCIDNDLTDEMNRSIGNEMMLTFAQLGNHYAKTFILKAIDIWRK